MTTGTTIKKPSDLTEGSIYRAIFKMGLPSMFGFVAHQIYAITDMFWVSRLPNSEESVAAITFFTVLLLTLFAFNTLIGPGSLAIISRRYGEKEYGLAEDAIKETFLLKLFFGILFGAIGWIFLGEFLYFLGARQQTLELGISYGKIFLFGLPIMYATYSIFTALRSIANPKWAMNLMFVASGLNILLDPLLIFGYWGFPAMGIEGAAYASVISFTIIFFIGLIVFSTRYVNVKLHLFTKSNISISNMWKILKIGIPVSAGELSFNTARLALIPIIAKFGTAVVAAYGVCIQVFSFGIMILFGIGLGLSSLIGQTIGSKKTKRTKSIGDNAIILGMIFMSIFGFICFFFSKYYLGLFFDSNETISQGVTILRIWSLASPFFGTFIMIEQIYVGVGFNIPSMILSFIQSWVIQITAAVVAVYYFNLNQNSIWWIMIIGSYICTTIFYLYYRKGQWLEYKV